MYFRFFTFAWFALFVVVAQAQNATVEYSSGPSGVDPNLAGYELILEARLVPGGPTIESGMVWNVFGVVIDTNGKLPLIATARGGTASVTLNQGAYLVHAAYGRAGASKKVNLSANSTLENIVLDAGGLQLNAESENKKIPANDLRFSIFKVGKGNAVERQIVAKDVPANKIVPLNSGTYHVLSHYGLINAEVRADLVVKPGEVTRATLQHRGAEVSLRLVSHSGGDPVANTAWSVFTEDGENVFDSNSISPTLILAEGTYEAAARNGNRNYKKTFIVNPGKNARIEIIVR